jgi:hypothetical protein
MILVVAAALIAWGAYSWITRDTSPSCSWPVRVKGSGTADEAGVVRCYVRALARHNMVGLYAVADYDPRPHLTAADLKYSADARAGVATAVLVPNSISVSIVNVTITYADGVQETVVLNNMQDMGDASTWRVDIG